MIKYFDDAGNEVEAQDATNAADIQTDQDGKIISSKLFIVDEEGEQEEAEKGPGKGWWGPPRGTHGKGEGGTGDGKRGALGSAIPDDDDDIDSAINAYLNDGASVNDWVIANEQERGAVKDKIITDLSERSGLPYEQTNDMIAQWADTSNDEKVASMSLQEAAAEEFGVELTQWQRERVVAAKESASQSKANFEILGLSSKEVNERMRKDGRVPLGTRTEERRFLRVMYNSTQESLSPLRESGVTLFRGTKERFPIGSGNIGIKINAMSSWAVGSFTTLTFGPTTLKSRVPIERVLSTSVTGFGCLCEGEFVILGSTAGVSDFATVVD